MQTNEFVVVANRLPVDRTTDADGNDAWGTSPGGLVQALAPVIRQLHGAWVGWPGAASLEVEPFKIDGIDVVPVTLTAPELEDFYEGMSNGTFWPLYHDVIAPPEYHREWWDAYVRVNQKFADAAAKVASRDATVWVHDYQLQLVPAMLRKQRPDVTIGYFHHIPFPAFGLFSQLPWRDQVLEGLLGADAIGFQRTGDALNFRRAVKTRLGNAVRDNSIIVREADTERAVSVGHYPISIETSMYDELASDTAIQARAREIRESLGNPKHLLLGVDRLDYTKGIRHRLKAFGELLDEGRLSVDETTMITVASPSRERVHAYETLRDEIEREVGRLNGAHDTLGHTAIWYLRHTYPREEMAAMYLAADVMLVTALRDGMNLVAKEYVATRVDERGVLVLSEFAGASDELSSAILINPHDIAGLKNAIMKAVDMPESDQRKRMRALRSKVHANDVARWSSSFVAAMADAAAGRSDS